MSIALMTHAWRLDIQSGRKMVLLAMCDSANDDGRCWPSVQVLMVKCSMGERTVQQHLAAMEEEGIIRREVRQGRSTMYTIDPRRICTPAESAPPQILHPPPQNPANTPADSAPTPADFAPRNVKETKENHKKKRKVARGTRLPENWILLAKHAKAAAEIDPALTADAIRLIGDKFKDHWAAVPGDRGCKLDWDATWRNWVRNSARFDKSKVASVHGCWWESEQSAAAKARELNIRASLPGESTPVFHARIRAAIDAESKGAAAAPAKAGQPVLFSPGTHGANPAGTEAKSTATPDPDRATRAPRPDVPPLKSFIRTRSAV